MSFYLNEPALNEPLNKAVMFERNEQPNQTNQTRSENTKDEQIKQLQSTVRILEQKIQHLHWAARIQSLS